MRPVTEVRLFRQADALLLKVIEHMQFGPRRWRRSKKAVTWSRGPPRRAFQTAGIDPPRYTHSDRFRAIDEDEGTNFKGREVIL